MTKRFVLVDLSVHLYMCTHIIKKGLPTVQKKGIKLENYIKSVLAIRLNNPIDFTSLDAQMLICDDTKVDGKYWRHEIVPEYKGTRKPKSELFMLVKQIAYEFIEQYQLAYYAVPLLEADDLIAYWCKKLGNDRNNQVYISSVDGDLQQLVTSNVFFAWTFADSSIRLFDNSLVCQYVAKKLRTKITHASEIAAVKALKGDSSDNLKRNSPIQVIDLNEPQYHEYVAPLNFELKTYTANKEVIKQAKAYCSKFGLPAPAC